jgi:hypothetical protein
LENKKMAHFAELDDNNVVLRVLVTDNDDPNGDEGYQWLVNNLGGRWIQTSYNGNIRKNFAGVGSTYDEERDAFIGEKLYPSHILDEETCQWVPPIPKPDNDKWYGWDEETLSWVDEASIQLQIELARLAELEASEAQAE